MERDHDTLQIAQDIESAGLGREPAQAISRAIHQHGRPLATKADVERLEKSTGERLDRIEIRLETLDARLDRVNMTIMGFGSALIFTLIGAIITMAIKT